MRTGCGPAVADDYRASRNEIAIVDVVRYDPVGNSCMKTQQPRKKQEPDNLLPSGTTGLHLNTSFTRALTYGRESSSEKSGKRALPTTASISAWAFFMASG